jgi:hypothetical protein
MIRPERTRKLTRPVHRVRRRCSTKATIADSTTRIATEATVRIVLLMKAMISM